MDQTDKNKQYVTGLRDNFKNIREFMNAKKYDGKEAEEQLTRVNRDLRDNFKNIGKYKDASYWDKDDRNK